jgi:hypothetical protein
LKHGKTACFLGHRRFLPQNHPFRDDEESFVGKTKYREAPVQPRGHEILEMAKGIHIVYGKLQRQKKTGKMKKKRQREEDEEELSDQEEVHTIEKTFKKRSIFFQLEY